MPKASSQSRLPTGARVNPQSNRVTLMFEVDEKGKTRRLSQNKILPTEPRSYSNDPAEVWAGHNRVTTFLASRIERGHTVRGFWEDWTNPDHHRWGIGSKRQESTLKTYRTRLRTFVDGHGDRPLLSIDERTIDKFMANGGRYSNLTALDTFFSDALKVGLIVKHPCRDMAREREAAERLRRQDTRPPVPDEDVLMALLDVAGRAPYPRSYWAWLYIGAETGMRGGELDAMKWEHLDGDRYYIAEQWNEKVQDWTVPKHRSFRTLRLSADALSVIEAMRPLANGSEFIFNTSLGSHWSHGSRIYWWERFKHEGLTLRDRVGGVSVYNATRHYWATMALNHWGIPIRRASTMFGHKDGGILMHKVYVRRDDEGDALAVQQALDARPRKLSAHRRAA